MIRGIVGVIPSHAVEAGRFYMAPNYQGGPRLFQCIQTQEPIEDSFRKKALIFTESGKPLLCVSDVPDRTPLLALDDVHIRVDPTSLAGDSFNTYLRRGLFVVRDDHAMFCAPAGFREWGVVNLSTGHESSQSIGTNWLTFTRWSLVMDDEAGDELTIASFENTHEKTDGHY
jgi:hypothetical protein